MHAEQHFSNLLEYTEWANRRVLAVVEDLSEEDLASAVGAGILGVLAHVVNVQRKLTARLDEGAEGLFEADSIAEIANAFDRSHEQLRSLAAGLASREMDFRPYNRDNRAADVETLLTQMVLHGVQHRAEVGLMLEAIGRSTGDLDYLMFKTEKLSET